VVTADGVPALELELELSELESSSEEELVVVESSEVVAPDEDDELDPVLEDTDGVVCVPLDTDVVVPIEPS
jgi:hypothetical protein